MDETVLNVLNSELKRQRNNIELIASENFVSREVMQVQGSILTNKYAEGYSGKRYYGGCEYIDVVEDIAIERVCKLFGSKYANVQPHSGSSANMAAIRALINHGDVVLGMKLDHGGHLTHGHPLSFSGGDYTIYSYGVSLVSELIDYSEVERLALKHKPKLIIAGASAYTREIDFKKFREIADKVDAYLLVDMAHIAGLVATSLHMNPCPYADVVTSTTHKTLRGPRGGIILTNDEKIVKAINREVFPGIQGGPLMHVIGAKAVAFGEALSIDFKIYQERVVENARFLASTLEKLGYRLVSGGTDNHIVLVDVKKSVQMTGKKAEQLLDDIGITCNKNTVPFDDEKPFITSGIRLGTAAMTTRGLNVEDFIEIAHIIDSTLKEKDTVENLRTRVLEITKKYPLYEEHKYE